MNVLSLFANIGVAEAYLEDIGFFVVLANEKIDRRAKLYSKIYPNTKMISGDITDQETFEILVNESKKLKIDVILATPPCQGMSTAGQKEKGDKRNNLIIPTIDIIERISPKYALIENVPLFLKTEIEYENKKILIPHLIEHRLDKMYHIDIKLVNSKDYSVPQSRERTIVLLTRKDQTNIWAIPKKHPKKITFMEAIGALPIVDPFIKDVSENELVEIFPHFHKRKQEALRISPWHKPPHHLKRQVIAMMHTPTGSSAFNNNVYKPVKENGELIKGFGNTYKRQSWDNVAYTVTMDNVKISSQNNVHPGRYLGQDKNGDDVYSDPRTLTLYEIMKIMTLPENWPVPAKTSEAFIRRIIGEGIPSLLVYYIFKNLNNIE